MYNAELSKSFIKDLKKLSPEVRTLALTKWIPLLQKDPDRGRSFKGERLALFLRLKFRYKRNDYRIVYQIKRKKVTILLLAIGSREAFYQRLDRRV